MSNNREVFRVLRPGGRFVVANLHPMRSAVGGWHRTVDGKKQHVILDRYFDEGEGISSELEILVEDNECGAFGISHVDVGNPNAFTDPNYQDEDGNPLPDCYVDIYDVIELATKWLDCSDISDPSCESYL